MTTMVVLAALAPTTGRVPTNWISTRGRRCRSDTLAWNLSTLPVLFERGDLPTVFGLFLTRPALTRRGFSCGRLALRAALDSITAAAYDSIAYHDAPKHSDGRKAPQR